MPETGLIVEELSPCTEKRSDTKESYPGCYDISSAGHIPSGVDFAPSAVRELKEEIGIDVLEDELIICGNRIIICDDVFRGIPYHDRQYTRVFALWCDLPEDDFILQEEEVSEVVWIGMDELIDEVENNKIQHCISPDELRMVKDTISWK